MNSFERKGLFVSMLVVALVGLAAFPMTVQAEHKAYVTQNVTLLEKLTGAWCPPCGSVSPTVDKIWDYFGPEKISLVEWHYGTASGSYKDPYSNAETFYRAATFYAVSGVPTFKFDGDTETVGADTFSNIADKINTTRATTRNFEITISGDVTTGNVNVHIEQESNIAASSLVLRTVIIESGLVYTGGTDPDDIYNHVARTYQNDTITLPIGMGGTDIAKSFTIKSGWDTSKLSVVAFLQDDSTKHVHQSCIYGHDGPSVPEISPLVLLPLTGLFLAVCVIAFRQRK